MSRSNAGGTSAIAPIYDRTDPRGCFRLPTGHPDLKYNRLAAYWRPLIDMRPSGFAPMRLRAIRYVNAWLGDTDSLGWAWFSRHSVAGLRHQVIWHAGLPQYACRDPRELPAELRTPEWNVLVEAIDSFDDLPPLRRRLVIFQLVQMSFYNVATALSEYAVPDGTLESDLYLYEVARAHTGAPAGAARAGALFEQLSVNATDPTLRLAAIGQGISHAIRRDRDLNIARRFESYATDIDTSGTDWLDLLIRSRYHRAVALLRLKEREFGHVRDEVMLAKELGEALFESPMSEADNYVAVENRRIVLESLIKAAARAPIAERFDRIRTTCDQLITIDPTCIQARLVVADGYSSGGFYAEAARWYELAGELGTGAGAMAWFRAGQCHELLGDTSAAVNAMGRCLELDSTAVQPREYLDRVGASTPPDTL